MKNVNSLIALSAALSMGISDCYIGGHNQSYVYQPTGRRAKTQEDQLSALEKAQAKREMRAAKRLKANKS